MQITIEDIKDIIKITLISSGVLAIVVTAISNFIVQRILKKKDNADNLKEEFRKNKIKALDELNNTIAEMIDGMRIIAFPADGCKARRLVNNTVMMITTFPCFENIDETKKLASKINRYGLKNQHWLDKELLYELQLFLMYLNNYIYYYEQGKLIPNKITVHLLRDDILYFINQISFKINTSYFKPLVKKKRVHLNNKMKKMNYGKEIKKAQRKAPSFLLMTLVEASEMNESVNKIPKEELINILKKYETNGELFIHGIVCKDCNLTCELAGLYFSDFQNTSRDL